MESLQGTFLLATNQMPDPRFQQTVILICFHDETDGAMGLVVNQPLNHIVMQDIFSNLNIDYADTLQRSVYFGGPVEVESAFIVHSGDYHGVESQQVMDQVFLTQDPQLLIDVAHGKGPSHYLFTMGYAGWGPGQLEQELAGEGWLSLPASPQDLFLLPADSMWQKVAARYGIDIETFTDIPGNA